MPLQDNACVFPGLSLDHAIPGIYAFYKERLALSHSPVPNELPLLGV